MFGFDTELISQISPENTTFLHSHTQKMSIEELVNQITEARRQYASTVTLVQEQKQMRVRMKEAVDQKLQEKEVLQKRLEELVRFGIITINDRY